MRHAAASQASTAGGAPIGLAAAIFIFFSGRMAGISGILGGLLAWPSGDLSWCIALLISLLAAPLVFGRFAPLATVQIDAGTPTLIGAGLLVGIGTRYGSGCTSGHGICGLARHSPGSLVATADLIDIAALANQNLGLPHGV